MDSNVLKNRTKNFALNCIKFIENIKHSHANSILVRQLIRASTSIGANYRAALRGKSEADFIYKITMVQEEADECIYWLELIHETNKETNKEIFQLLNEANELTAIFTTTLKTIKSKKNQK